ncbi:MAG: MarR family winged helix-turn-helix transcriptional regulator [Solirubrobacteraceae bacterium]|nr:MarR family winged helix-turn-helix transcriptional regulator [Solirubrobacteraceae bacterium]
MADHHLRRRLPADDGADDLDLDRRLVVALERVAQALRVLRWDAATRHGLSPVQMQLLLRLGHEPPARRRVGELAGELDLSQGTISEAVAALRRKGLVERGARSGSRGGHPLSLTVRGRLVADELEDWQAALVARLSPIDQARKEAALGLLLELIGGLQREGVVTVARMCTTCRFFRRDAHPEAPLRHHCALLDSPLGSAELRVDCAEHELAGAAT